MPSAAETLGSDKLGPIGVLPAEGSGFSPRPAGGGLRFGNSMHGVHGPADVTAVLELFDRRYRDARGEDDPCSSQDSA